MSDSFELPLFPLDLVLLPFKRVPLHIFEERYKQLINRCLEEEEEFGIVSGTDNHFHTVGCAARVTELIARFPDGRINIIIQGTRRFRVLERLDGQPCITGIVEEVDDEPEDLDTDLFNRVQSLYQEALKLSLGWLRPSGSEHMDPARLSYVVASSLNLSSEEQQLLLEATSPNRRLENIAEHLATTLEGIREIKRRTGGNGHLA